MWLRVCVCSNPCTFFFCCNPHMEKSVTRVLFFFAVTRVKVKKLQLAFSTLGLHQKKSTRVTLFSQYAGYTKKNKVHGLHFFPYAGYSKNKKYTGYTFFQTRVRAKKKSARVFFLLYPWHRHEDIRRYPWYIPRDIAAVISCGIYHGYLRISRVIFHGYLRISRVNSPKLKSVCNSEGTDTLSILCKDYH